LHTISIFFGQATGIDETNTFQLKFFSSMKIVGATGLGRLSALALRKKLRYLHAEFQ